MALDYVISGQCPITEEMEPQDIFQISKFRDILAYFEQNRDDFIAENPGKTFEQIEVHMQYARRPNELMTYGTVKEEWEYFNNIGEQCCKDCPVNFRRRVIGCYGAINYPLTQKFEEWLISNYNPPAGLPDVVIELIEENDVTGEESDANRGPSEEMRPSIFEAPEPLRKKVPCSENSISTTQIMNILMGIGEIKIDLSWSLLISFNAVKGKKEDIDTINKLILYGVDLSSKDGKTNEGIIFNRYSGAFKDNGGILFNSSEDLPLGLHKEENVELLGHLLSRIEFAIEREETDDRPISGFKLFLYANFVAVKTMSVILGDG